MRLLVTLPACLLLAPDAGAGGPPDDPKAAAAQAALATNLSKTDGAQAGRVLPVTGPDGRPLLAAHHVFAVRFRGYPVKPPESFRASNLFAVAAGGTVTRLADEKALEAFARKAIPPATDDESATAAARTWLRLAEELHQDGYYTFAFDPASAKVATRAGKRVASGAARVTAGGTGAIQATVTFAADGTIEGATTDAKLTPSGDRPAGGRK